MSATAHYALLVLLMSVVGLVAVLSNRVTERLKIPAPALVFVAAALAVAWVPGVHHPDARPVEDIVTIALVFILFDGGMHIGFRRFRAAAKPIVIVGVVGTFFTTAGAAVLLAWGFGIPWYAAVLVATAVAPTDPAIVFSVLGKRQIAGRSSTILEGESGANDPVGIALMAALLAAGGLSGHAFGSVGIEFVLQMVVGAVVGVVGARALLWFMRAVPLPSEALYPLRTLACVPILYGVATLAHGSGFLAVFVAGILVGDARAPYKVEIQRFHAAVASLAEIVAFVALGLTVDLGQLSRSDVLVPGLVLALVLAFVIRPVVVGLCLVPARLRRSERNFVVFAGLKGAVPILLAELLREADIPGADRWYGIVAVVVIFSVFVQASLTPVVAARLKLPMRTVEPEPWSLGVRLRDEPAGVHRLTVAAGSPADGRALDDLTLLGERMWISFIVRDSGLVRITGETELHVGDEVLVLADPDLKTKLTRYFERPAG
ncbi:MAG: cation:proton antiporter [Nostocoides sp.]